MSTGPDTEISADRITKLFQQRRYAEVEAAARSGLATRPDDGFLWKAIGAACAAQGKASEALEAKERAVQLAPQDAEAHTNLGNALADGSRFARAEGHFRAALQLDARLPNAWRGLAGVLARTGRLRDAAACHEKICELQAGSVEALNLWGNALRLAQMMREAKAAYERCLAIDPRNVEALTNLANTLADLGQPGEAEARYREALALQPSRAEIHNNLGNLLKFTGRHEQALQCFHEALRLQPDFVAAHTNYLLALNHAPDTTPQKMKAAAQAFGHRASAKAGPPVFKAGWDASRPLRVGLVSGDLRTHPVGYFLEGVLAHWPRERAQLFAYPTMLLADEATQRMRPRFERWTPIANMDDAQAAARIAQDGIDVLVDLAGHTAHNRLPLFAWRPARVQATWLGYFATTGIEQMDWLLSDAASIAPDEEDAFTEKIWRLPGTRLCFTPPQEAPAVATLPALQSGAITFGSFQNLGKINDGVLTSWSRVLDSVPGSRLRVQNAQLGEEQAQRRFCERLAGHGIDPSRVSLHGKQARAAYLAAHAHVDIALDTFPYPGGTTTCEALWMGVPTITRTGNTMLARQGESLLVAAGLHDWIARSDDEYVRLAVAHAADLAALADLRAGLRERVAASALFDAKKFAHELAEAFIAMSLRA